MTHLDKQEFHAWAYDDLLTNTTRVFCLLNGTDRKHVDPLNVAQWTFYVLPTSLLNRKVPQQKTIRLEPLRALAPRQCTYDELPAAIRAAAEVSRDG